MFKQRIIKCWGKMMSGERETMKKCRVISDMIFATLRQVVDLIHSAIYCIFSMLLHRLVRIDAQCW